MRRRQRQGRFVESAAQRAHELDLERELARAQVGVEALLREQRGLGAQHLQVVADAFAITQERKVIGFLCRCLRLDLLPALLIDAPKGRELIDDIADRVGKRLVVLLDRDVVIRVLAGKVRAQPSRIEDRQARRGTETHHPTGGGKKSGAAEALQADEGYQIDIGIELRLGRGDVLLRGFDAGAARDEIGPATEQFRRQCRRQHDRIVSPRSGPWPSSAAS